MNLEVFQNVKQLAQSRPSDTNAVSVLAKAVKRQVVVTSIVISNTTGSAATYSIFLDKDGTTYSQATALYYAVSLAANATMLLEFDAGLPFDKATAGNLAVQSGTGSALTYTVNGVEF